MLAVGKKKFRINIKSISLVYLIIWTVSPFMEVDMIWRILALVAAALWFLVSIKNGSRINEDKKKAIFFLMAVFLIVGLETMNPGSLLKQIPTIMLVIFYIMFIDYGKEDGFYELTALIPIIMLLLIFFNIQTYRALINDSYLARAIVRNDADTYSYLRRGIGGYSLVYPQVIVFPVFLYWTEKVIRFKKLWFIIGCVWVVSFVLLVSAAGYSIAVFASVLGFFFLHIYRGKGFTGVMIVSLILFFGIIIGIIHFDGLRNTLLDFFNGTAIERKINDLMASYESNVYTGSIWDRIKAYTNSINVIFNYPLIGSLFFGSGGGHSAILDTTAKYGLWGAIIYCRMLFAAPRKYLSLYKRTPLRKVANASFATMVFVALLDPFTYSFMGMTLIVIPIALEDILYWTGIKNESSLGC